MERNYKSELQTEHDMGITVDLVLADAYALPSEDIELDPKDEKLLEEDFGTTVDRKRRWVETDSKKSSQLKKSLLLKNP